MNIMNIINLNIASGALLLINLLLMLSIIIFFLGTPTARVLIGIQFIICGLQLIIILYLIKERRE
jgi:hypothetical protein